MGRLQINYQRSYLVGILCGIITILSIAHMGLSLGEGTEAIRRVNSTPIAGGIEKHVMLGKTGASKNKESQLVLSAQPWKRNTKYKHEKQQLVDIQEAHAVSIIPSYAKSKNAMVYMEPRRHKDAMYVLYNFHTLMPEEWDLLIICSQDNLAYLKKRASKIRETREVHYLSILPAEFSGKGYNALFLQLDFWNQINFDTVLVFQSDSILCANSPHRIEDFMHYKYIGCAMGNAYGASSHQDWSPRDFYGSGGLTVRNVQYHRDCLTNPKLQFQGQPMFSSEDIFFSKCAHEGLEGDRAENVTILQQFCTQEGFYQPSFGMHKIWDQGYRFAPSHIRKMVAHCPEIIPLRAQIMNEPAWNSTSPPFEFDVEAFEQARLIELFG